MQGRQFIRGKVSIVTPVYNGEKHLSNLLDSILAQTYGEMEFILVDDGSEDGTLCAAAAYAERFRSRGIPFTVLSCEHSGAAGAMCKGLPLVTGEYLIWPDSDDVLDPESVELRVQFLNQHPDADSVRSLAYYFEYSEGRPLGAAARRAAPDERIGDPHSTSLFWDILFSRTFVCCGCYMLRSQLFFDIYPDGQIPIYPVGQNFQMLLPYMYRHNCQTLQRELYAVAVRPNSHSRTPLTEDEERAKYRHYENMVDEISRLCALPSSQAKMIRDWKYGRRVALAQKHKHPGEVEAVFLEWHFRGGLPWKDVKEKYRGFYPDSLWKRILKKAGKALSALFG